MRAVTVTRHGPPSVLELREYPDPLPGEGQVRVAVAAAGLNFAELSARAGIYPDAPKPPCVVGYEVAGVVDAVGPGVLRVSLGDRVLALCRFGGHASSVVVSERQCFPVPDGKELIKAAAIPVTYLTAHHALFQIGTVHPGARVLVHSAAGGVGVAAIQLLRTVPDVRIVGTASPAKHDFLREMGCDVPLDGRAPDLEAQVRVATNGRGCDIVLDALGGSEWKRSWRLLAPAGRMVAFGVANAHAEGSRNLFQVLTQLIQVLWVTPLSAMAGNKGLQGVNMGALWDEAEMLSAQMARIIELWKEGVVRPHIHAVVPFAEAARAHEMLERRENRGKVILVPEQS